MVASPQCRPFRGRFVAQKRARKRGNLSIIDNVRTNAQQHTQHAQDTPQNDSCGQLQTMCDCPAVFSASSVHASGQRRPFRRAFKSQMRSSRLPGHLKVTLTLRSNQASSPMTLRLRRRGKEVEKGVDRPQVAGGKSSGGVRRRPATGPGTRLLSGRSEAAAAVSGSGAPRVSTSGTPERQWETEQKGGWVALRSTELLGCTGSPGWR